MSRRRKCALIGKTLGHSFSPMIHSAFGLYDYGLESMPEDALGAFLRERVMERGEYDGLNVTIPYKQAVMPFCDKLSQEAQAVGCVNTLVRTAEGKLLGYNTDVDGFLHIANRSGIDFAGKKALILGTGGTSLTAAYCLKLLGTKEIIKVSRRGPVNYENADRDAEIIVNTTPVGMYPGNGKSPVDLREFTNCQGVLDVIYNPLKTALLLQAEELGIPCENGLAMLVAQAKKSGEYFVGHEISNDETDLVHALLKKDRTNVVLIGMPGSGKSTIAQLLAEQMRRPVLEMDQMIAEEAGMTIPEIFAKDGESGFRDLETRIAEKVGKETGVIVSTGGGAMLRHENYLHLKQNGTIYFLQRELFKLPTEGERPLSKDLEALEKMYQIRLPIYQSCADVEVDNNGLPQKAAEKILLHHQGNQR